MRRFTSLASVVLAAVALSLGTSHATPTNSAQATWTITNLATPGERFSEAMAVNETGEVVGWRQPNSRDLPHAVLWQHGRVIDLGTLGGDVSYAIAINDRGQIIGQSDTAAESMGVAIDHGFLWQNGKMTDLGTLGGVGLSFARAINDRGQVVGTSSAGFDASGPVDHAFLWQDGKMRDLGTLPHDSSSEAVAINNRGQVIGYSQSAKSIRAFLWQTGKMIDLGTITARVLAVNDSSQVALNAGGHAGVWLKGTTRVLDGLESRIVGINDLGQAVGSYLQTRASGLPKYRHACLWQGGRLIDLTPNGNYSGATEINRRGQIIGWIKGSTKATAKPGAFVWQAGHYAKLPDPLGAGVTAKAINDRGQIVGYSGSPNPSRSHAVIWTPRVA